MEGAGGEEEVVQLRVVALEVAGGAAGAGHELWQGGALRGGAIHRFALGFQEEEAQFSFFLGGATAGGLQALRQVEEAFLQGEIVGLRGVLFAPKGGKEEFQFGDCLGKHILLGWISVIRVGVFGAGTAAGRKNRGFRLRKAPEAFRLRVMYFIGWVAVFRLRGCVLCWVGRGLCLLGLLFSSKGLRLF